MLVFFTVTAVFLFLVPILVWTTLRCHRERTLGAIALDVPMALAMDLLSLLVLAYVMQLQAAVIVSRLIWLATGAVVGARRWRCGALRWPTALGRREAVTALTAIVSGVALSMIISSECYIADRAWHMALVSSLRGQVMPFHNVYQPGVRFDYHWTGDVVAAMLQSLSFGHMHSALALAVVHDLLFGLLALIGAFLLSAFGLRSVPLTLIGALAPLLAGPLTLPLLGGSPSHRGYNFISYYHLSFRPHSVLAGVFIIGFAGAILLALRGRDRPAGWRTAAVLVACTAALTLTDEASTGLLGLALGTAWLVAPGVLHTKRTVGVGMLALLLAAVLAPHYLFAGTLGPGSLPQHVGWVPWRAPGYFHRELPLSDAAGIWTLIRDFLPLALLAAGGLLSIAETRTREQLATVLGFFVLLAVTLVLLCGVEITADVPVPGGGFGGQNHRFVTAALIMAPLSVAAALLPDTGGPPRWSIRGTALALGVAAVLLSSASTLGWVIAGSERSCTKSTRFGARDELLAVDCRRETEASPMGERARSVYGAASVLYLYLGCIPSYTTGSQFIAYRTIIGLGSSGQRGLDGVDGFAAPGESIRAVCPTDRRYRSDVICDWARAHSECRPLGEKMTVCSLPPEDRRHLLEPRAAPQAREKDAESSQSPRH